MVIVMVFVVVFIGLLGLFGGDVDMLGVEVFMVKLGVLWLYNYFGNVVVGLYLWLELDEWVWWIVIDLVNVCCCFEYLVMFFVDWVFVVVLVVLLCWGVL